jgi:hypothetical protein
MLGVIPTAPGYASFHVTVPLHALSYASGRVPTPHGPINVAWTRPAAATRPFEVDVIVPVNTDAMISIPAVALGSVRESGIALSRAAGVTSASMNGDYAVVKVGAGSYHFTSTNVPAVAIGTGPPPRPGATAGAQAALGSTSRPGGDLLPELSPGGSAPHGMSVLAMSLAVSLGALALALLAGALLLRKRRHSAGT